MTKTNRIFKENYSLRPSTIFKLGYSLATVMVGENQHAIRIILDENNQVTLHDVIFESTQKAQDHVNENKVFIVHTEYRDTIHAHTFKDDVLTYEVDGDNLLAIGNSGKTPYFKIGEINHIEEYFDLKALEGKTVSEVIKLHTEWTENAHSDYEHEMGKSMYNFYYGGNSIDDCTSCGGGGCVHCSPKDFI